MSYLSPIPADLSTYLGSDVDENRAALILQLAEKRCLAVVDPLPDGAEAVVLDVAARAFVNPQNIQSAATGPYMTSYGTIGGGLWLTRQNEASLRALAGSGGAFSIDPTPADAGPANTWAQVPTDPTQPGSYPFYGDWDVTP